MPPKITFDGTEYDNPEDMPAGIREAFERAMASLKSENSGGRTGPGISIKLTTRMRFVHDGKTYNSLDEMPPELRAKYEKAVQQVDQDHDGIPDFLEGKGNASADSLPASSDPAQILDSPMAPVSHSPSVIQPERSDRALLITAGLVILFLLLIVAGLLVYITSH